jgi:hypothetical protein
MTAIKQQKRIANTLILQFFRRKGWRIFLKQKIIIKSMIRSLPIKITEDVTFEQQREQTMPQALFNRN